MEASALRAPAGLRRGTAARLLTLRSDDQLVALVRMGFDDAFDVVHDRYRQRLLAYTRQMLRGSGVDPEDALQDVFLRAYHALRADDRPVTLRAWLYRVAHNRCIDQLRRPASQSVELPENVVALHGSDGADPHADMVRRDDLRRLVTDISGLPEQQRSALLMRELEGLSYQELADALEASVPAVKSLLVRARMGLVEAQEARDTACHDIRDDLVSAHDRGVRSSGRARRHLRECTGCRDFRDALKGLRTGFAALAPSGGHLATLAKLLGLGGAGASGGAAAGGGLAAGGGVVTLGGGAVAATATKVVAIACGVAVVGGGAAEVTRRVVPDAEPKVGRAQAATPAAAPARTARGLAPAATVARESADRRRAAGRERGTVPAPAPPPAVLLPAVLLPTHHDAATDGERVDADRAGGVLAPDEAAGPASDTASSSDGLTLADLLRRATGRGRDHAAAGSGTGSGASEQTASSGSGGSGSGTSSTSSAGTGTASSGSGTSGTASGTSSGTSGSASSSSSGTTSASSADARPSSGGEPGGAAAPDR